MARTRSPAPRQIPAENLRVGRFAAWLTMLAQHIGLRSPFGRDVARSFGIQLASTGLSFLVAVTLARLLGTAGYGIYAFAWALVTLLALPAQAGLPMLVVRETARGLATDHPEHVCGIWLWAGRVAAMLSVATAVAGVAVIAFGYSMPLDPQAQTVVWALALVPLITLGKLRGAALRGLRRVLAGQLPEFVIRPGLLFLLLIAVSIGSGGLMPQTAMVLHVLAAVAAFLVGAGLLARSAPPQVRVATPEFKSRHWLASTLPLALIGGLQVVNRHTDVLMLGLLQPADQVGIYRAASQVAVLTAFGLSALNIVMAPRFAHMHARGETDRLQQFATQSARVALAFGAAITLCFVAIGEPLLTLVFGTPFADAYLPLVILLVGQLCNSATGSVGSLLNMTGHERDTAKGVATAALLNVALNLMLIPLWGVYGAATATAVSLITWNMLLWWKVRKRLGINSFAFNLPSRQLS